jgi:L-ascorbate metabolism protein UlaG (beta-lactamase superfamily)
MVPTNFDAPPAGQIKCTWIGHATAVIQLGQDSFIIDPVFMEKNIKKRYRPPACKISQLPPIDVVLVSHDHTDHFDTTSI